MAQPLVEQMQALAADMGGVVAGLERKILQLEERLAASESTALELMIDLDARLAALEARLAELSPVKHTPPRLLDAAD